jgi:hypothetical protein
MYLHLARVNTFIHEYNIWLVYVLLKSKDFTGSRSEHAQLKLKIEIEICVTWNIGVYPFGGL